MRIGMRRVFLPWLLAVALLCAPQHAAAAITHIISTGATLGVGGGTTGAVNTTGCDFLFLIVASYTGSGVVVGDISDSKGNTWTAVTSYGSGDPRVYPFYAKNATCGSGHTFTVSRGAIYASLSVTALAGVHLTAPLDQQNGGNSGGSAVSTFKAGSISATAGSVTFAGYSVATSATNGTVDGGAYTVAYEAQYSIGSAYGAHLFYKLNTSGTEDPEVTWAAAQSSAGTTISFLAAGGGPPPLSTRGLLTLGVGN
jgi:hypothetical protein